MMLRRMAMVAVVILLCAAPAAATELQWWSHWAIEDSKKAVLFEAKRRFEAANPGHTVTITFYEKKNMWPTLRAAFTAGSGFPDVFYYDMDVPEFMTAGWLADLSSGVRWQNIEPFGKAFWTRPGPGGKTGTWAIPVEAASDEIYYNRKMFKELGITVPANFAFTQDQFKDVVAKCAKAGYAAFATGAADREWAAHYVPNALLLDKLGADETLKLFRGELSWKDPRVVEVFRYYKELIDLGAYAKTLSSMTLAEAHRYFHTEQKACMFPVGSWYTGRAFVPSDKGGQPKDFELGNMWMAKTGVQTGIKTDPAKIDSPLKWYFDEYARVNKTTRWVDLTAQQVRLLMKPGLWETYVATVNQGLPNKLIGPDELVGKLEEARLKGK